MNVQTSEGRSRTNETPRCLNCASKIGLPESALATEYFLCTPCLIRQIRQAKIDSCPDRRFPAKIKMPSLTTRAFKTWVRNRVRSISVSISYRMRFLIALICRKPEPQRLSRKSKLYTEDELDHIAAYLFSRTLLYSRHEAIKSMQSIQKYDMLPEDWHPPDPPPGSELFHKYRLYLSKACYERHELCAKVFEVIELDRPGYLAKFCHLVLQKYKHDHNLDHARIFNMP